MSQPLNSLATNPGLAAAETAIKSTPVQPATLLDESGSMGDPKNRGSVAPTASPVVRKAVQLPVWLAVLVLIVGVLFVGHQAIYRYNWNAPFQVSDSLDHQGPWYRQAAVAPIDWVKSRSYYVQSDFWGNKRVVYQVGDRRFIQAKSGEPAVEVYDTK